MIAFVWLCLILYCHAAYVTATVPRTSTKKNATILHPPPPSVTPHLCPLAQRWLDVVEGFGRDAHELYEEVAAEYLVFYKSRAAQNAATIKRLGIHADIPALVPDMWQDECNVWLGIREYLTGLEQRIYPALFVLSRSIVHLVGVEFRDDPKVIEAIRRLENVIQVAKDEYAENARDSRNRGLRALRRQMNSMLAMHRQACSPANGTVDGQQLQRDYEAMIDRTSKPVLDAMRGYWSQLKRTFTFKVAGEDHIQSMFLLTMV